MSRGINSVKTRHGRDKAKEKRENLVQAIEREKRLAENAILRKDNMRSISFGSGNNIA